MKIKHLIAVGSAVVATTSVGVITSQAAQAVEPTTRISTSAALFQVHVNSTGPTRLFASPYGDANYGYLPACTNFFRDDIVNGRYHSPDLGGWVSTDKAGPGWCGD